MKKVVNNIWSKIYGYRHNEERQPLDNWHNVPAHDDTYEDAEKECEKDEYRRDNEWERAAGNHRSPGIQYC